MILQCWWGGAAGIAQQTKSLSKESSLRDFFRFRLLIRKGGVSNKENVLMKIKSLWGEMFCQFLFVGYKEIYWILPVCHISWCPVVKGHSENPYFSPHMWEFYASKVWSINQHILFTRVCIHKETFISLWLHRRLDFFSILLLRHSQLYIPFHETSEKESPNCFWNCGRVLWGMMMWNPSIFTCYIKCNTVNHVRF